MNSAKNKQIKYPYKINLNGFKVINSPHFAYVLGLLWADGYVSGNNITIECREEDLSLVKNVFDKTGYWKITTRKRDGRKLQMIISIWHPEFAQFLKQLGYYPHSSESACEVLKIVPEKLHHYWFLGCSDGDGCFYCNKEISTFQYSIAGNYYQDWSFARKKFEQLSIKSTICFRSKINKKGILNKSSQIRFTGMENLKIWGDFLYQDFATDSIGLPRKYFKYLIARNKWLENVNRKLNR